MSDSKSAYFYKLFRVRRSDGRVTTVSLDPALVAQACRRMGGLPVVGQAVRSAALAYEDGTSKNCSYYVAAKLREAMAAAAEAAAAAAHAEVAQESLEMAA